MSFTYTVTVGDWAHIAPLLALLGVTLLIMLIDIALPARLRGSLVVIALLGVVIALASVVMLYQMEGGSKAFFGMISSDGLALFGSLVILVATGLALLLAPGYIERQGVRQQGEFYALVMLAATGMVLMVAASNLMTIFLGLELLSLPLYVLCAFTPGQPAAQESGMKYFLLSSFASGFLLYGMALLYGATGTTDLDAVHRFVAKHPVDATGYGPLLLLGAGLLVVGLAFKVSAIPFHAWTPDVYQGAPTPITALMSVGTKTAAFVALARVFDGALAPVSAQWVPLIAALAIVTMLGGNILAATQTNVKRLLAYSSIAHAGYLLIGIAVATPLGLSATLFYLAAYGVMNIGAFGVLVALERTFGLGTQLADFRGLGGRRPALAGAMAVMLLSLAGIPGTVGFIAKYSVFYAAVMGGHSELLIIGVLSSMISFYYYLRIIWAMYFDLSPETSQTSTGGIGVVETASGVRTVEAREALRTGAAAAMQRIPNQNVSGATLVLKTVATAPPLAIGVGISLALAVIATIALGILPGPLVDLARMAVGLR